MVAHSAGLLSDHEHKWDIPLVDTPCDGWHVSRADHPQQKTMRTHYHNLQVQEGADPAVIKASFKALAQRYHPDRNPDDPQEAERIFRIIAAAYEVLSDPAKRALYDASLKAIREQAESHTPIPDANGNPGTTYSSRRYVSPELTEYVRGHRFARVTLMAISKLASNPRTPAPVKWLLTPAWRLVLVIQIPIAAYLFRDVLF